VFGALNPSKRYEDTSYSLVCAWILRDKKVISKMSKFFIVQVLSKNKKTATL
jgi:hypothetical protein